MAGSMFVNSAPCRPVLMPFTHFTARSGSGVVLGSALGADFAAVSMTLGFQSAVRVLAVMGSGIGERHRGTRTRQQTGRK